MVEARIITPAEGDRVGSRIKVQGYVTGAPPGSRFWIAHRRAPGGLFWPKDPEVNLEERGRFALTTVEGGAPGRIVISLLMTKASISHALERGIEHGNRTGDFPGIDPSSCDATELDSVTVTYDNRRPLRLFYSYAHEDEGARRDLEKHLSSLRRRNLIEDWHDRCVTAGQPFDEAIRREIDRADLILLLISASFMASDYCYHEEMSRALRRHARGETRVIPVIVRAIDWRDSAIGPLLALPTDARPVKSWPNEDEAWADVAQGIRDVIEELR